MPAHLETFLSLLLIFFLLEILQPYFLVFIGLFFIFTFANLTLLHKCSEALDNLMHLQVRLYYYNSVGNNV